MIHGWLLRRHCIWRLLSRYVQFFRITPLFVRSEIIDDAIPDCWSSLTKQMTFRDMVFFAGMGGVAQTDCSMTSWTHTKLYVKLFDYLSLQNMWSYFPVPQQRLRSTTIDWNVSRASCPKNTSFVSNWFWRSLSGKQTTVRNRSIIYCLCTRKTSESGAFSCWIN